MGQSDAVSITAAMAAGFLTFLSPCILPLIPAYVSYIAGASFDELKEQGSRRSIRRETLVHSLFFVLGFFFIVSLTIDMLEQ